MEVCLGKTAYDVQDQEMFSLIESYHNKAIAKFMEAVGDKLTESQKKTMECPVRVTLSNSLRTSGGNARMGMFITLNYRLMKQNMNDLEWIYVHELAHIICQRLYPREKGHGRTWKSVNSLLGFDPKRTHRLNTEGLAPKTKTFVYHCGCMTHTVSARKHKMMQSGRSRICKSCRGTLVLPSNEILEMMKKVGITTEPSEQRLIG